MINLLVALLVAAVILYVFFLVLNLIPLPPPIKQIVLIIVGLIALLWLLDFTGLFHLGGTGHGFRLK